MTTTYHDAVDSIFGTAKTVFDGYATTLLGYAPDVRYPGVPNANKPDKSKLWARCSSQIVTDVQASLSNVNNISFFFADGLFYIQLFCPRNVGGSIDKGRLIAEALQKAYRASPLSGEMWYSKVKIVELAETEENYPINVSGEYQYKTTSR